MTQQPHTKKFYLDNRCHYKHSGISQLINQNAILQRYHKLTYTVNLLKFTSYSSKVDFAECLINR